MISKRVRDRFVARHGEPANLDELGLALVDHINNLGATSKGRDKGQRVLGLVWNISSGEQCNSHNAPVVSRVVLVTLRGSLRFMEGYG